MGKESSHHDTTKPEALATPITPVGQLAASWPEPKFDKPPVYWDANGVPHVRASDIFLSRVGQAELNAALRYAGGQPQRMSHE